MLSGVGTLRDEDGHRPLAAGDFVALPADESGGHQVVNDGDEDLRYLMVSAMRDPDVTVYPDMEKFGVFVGAAPGGGEERSFEGSTTSRSRWSTGSEETVVSGIK